MKEKLWGNQESKRYDMDGGKSRKVSQTWVGRRLEVRYEGMWS